MKKQGTLENRANYVYLALGSNLGNKISNLIKTQQLIIESNIQILKSSSFYKTESWPNKKFPFYVNSVILVKTSFNPIKLFNIIKSIELPPNSIVLTTGSKSPSVVKSLLLIM